MNTSPTQSSAGRPMLRALVLTVLLVIAWLLWSGLFKPLLLGLGVFSCALTVYIVHRMGHFRDATLAVQYSPRLIGFWAWLGKEIVVSSIDVTRIVLSKNLRVSPQTLALDVKDLKPVDQVLLANSITLTPGTLALDIYQDRLLVHALTKESAAGLAAGEMQRRVAALQKN